MAILYCGQCELVTADEAHKMIEQDANTHRMFRRTTVTPNVYRTNSVVMRGCVVKASASRSPNIIV